MVRSGVETPSLARSSPGRKQGSGAINDAEPLKKMLRLLAEEKVPSVWAAAGQMAGELGGISKSSGQSRLARKFKTLFGTVPKRGQTWAQLLAHELDRNSGME